MYLTERNAQSAALSELLAGCLAGRGSLAVVSGPVASGKTALLHAFAEEAGRAGAVSLWATASRTERDLPLEVVGQLVSGADMADADRRRLTQSLEGATLAASSPQRAADRFKPRAHMQLLRHLGRVLLDPAGQPAAVIIVDDVHHADTASLECLLYLARRVTSGRVLILLSECTSYRQEYSRFRAEVLLLPYCRQLSLGPLSHRGVAGMLAEEVGPARARTIAHAYHRLSGGSPLLVRALLEDRRVTAQADAIDPVPGKVYGQAVLTSVYRSEPVALDVARAVAVLDGHASLAVLEEILDASPDAIADALGALNAGGLLAAGRFRHEVARTAVSHSLDGDLRGLLNNRAARILHAHGATSAIVARHLLAARDVDADWAAPVLCDAAAQALAEDQAELAISCLRAARDLCTGPGQSLAVRAALLRAEWRAGSLAADRYLPDLAAAAREHQLSAADTTALLGYLLWYGRAAPAVDLLDSLHPPADAAPPTDAAPPVRAQETASGNPVRSWLEIAYPGLVNRPRREIARPPYEGLVPVQRMSRRSASLLLGILAQDGDDDRLGGAEGVLQGCRLEGGSLAAIVGALGSLILTNKLDKAVTWCGSLRAEAAGRQAPMWEALFAAVGALIDIRLGRLAAAEKSARAALTLAAPRSWGVAVCLPLASMLEARIAMGAQDDAAACLRTAVPDEAFQTIGAPYYLHARGRFHLATGHPYAALNDFESCRDLMLAWGLDIPALVSWRTDMAEAWLRLGETARARDLVHDELARLRPGHLRVRGIALRILALASDVGQRQSLLDRSAEALSGAGDLFELAMTCTELGNAHWALGDERQGRAMARQAHRLAQGCGARLPLGAVPAQTTNAAAVAELSGAELRVAELAAQGHTNRQIAAKLFITVSTVEQHLTRVYRKLQLRRRADLPVVLQWRIPAFDFSGLRSWDPVQGRLPGPGGCS